MLGFNIHFNELKARTLYLIVSFFLTFFVSYFYIDFLIYFLSIPFLQIRNPTFLSQSDFVFTSLFEVFFAYLTVSFFISLYFTAGLALFLIFAFLKPGLLRYEKNRLTAIGTIYFVCFFFSMLLLYQMLLSFVLHFFINFETLDKTGFFTLKLEARLLDYLYISLSFFIWTTAIFQLPFFIAYLVKSNLLHFKTLENNRRFVVISVLIFAAILSPPEIFAQILIAFPFYFLFECSLLFSYLRALYKRKR